METANTPAAEPSMSDLRAMLAGSEPTEPKTETPEPVKAEPEPEAVKEPADTKQEPIEKDEPLPEGVQKRIAKEAEKAARIQSEIDRAVSTRKAKEKELADLTAPGPAPVQKADTAAKKAPEFGEAGHESETYAAFQSRDREHFKAEIAAETRRSVEQEFTQRQRQERIDARVNEGAAKQIEAGAVKDVGEFNAHMETLVAGAPDGLQNAISSLDDWAAVGVHLAKNPSKLADLATMYGANPYAAIIKLGNLQASLKPATKPADEPKLPNPPAKEGGGASASSGAFDIEKASIHQMRRQAEKLGLRKAG